MANDATFGFEEDFQKAIAAVSLQDPNFLKQYDDIVLPGYFDFEYLSSIIRIARELTERLGEVPTKMSLVEEVKEFCIRFNMGVDDREFILGKIEEIYTISTHDSEYIRDRVVTFGQRQAIRSAVLKIVTMINDPRKNTDESTYEQSRDMLEAALRVGLDARNLGFDLYPNLERMPEIASSTIAGIHKKVPTGFDTIDKHTMGGPGRGEVWVVVGLPGRGKSAFLVNIGVAALKHGFPVIHFTIGDLKEEDVGLRYAARLTMCSTYEVITGSEMYMKKAKILARYNPHLRIKYYSSDTATVGHLRAFVARVRALEEFSPAVIIVDYPEELKMAVSNDMYQSGGKNYSALSAMGDEFEALVWAASQPKTLTMLNKAHQDPNYVIQGQEMAESGKKFQKVDGMVSWNMTYEEELFGRGRLWVDKTRRGKSFYLTHCDVDLEKMSIREGKAPEAPASVADPFAHPNGHP